MKYITWRRLENFYYHELLLVCYNSYFEAWVGLVKKILVTTFPIHSLPFTIFAISLVAFFIVLFKLKKAEEEVK